MYITLIYLLLVVLCIASTLFATPTQADEGYFHTHTCYMYVGKWVWDDNLYGGGWRLPDVGAEVISGIDLRSLPELGVASKDNPGYAFIFSSAEINLPGYFFLGTDFNLDIPPAAKNFLQNRYNITLSSYTNNGTIWELFAEEGDLTGLLRWPPLTPKQDGTLEILINGFSPVVFAKDKPRCNTPKLMPFSPPRPPFLPWPHFENKPPKVIKPILIPRQRSFNW